MNFRLYNNCGEENIYSPYSMLGLGMKEFEFKRSWPKQYHFAGACCETPLYYREKINKEKISDILEEKYKYKRKILVTLGTHLKWAKKTLTENIEKIAENFEDTLFVVTMGEKNREFDILAGKIKENMVITDYLPYTGYLDSFDYVIHHGGAGITYNCIKYKKPSLVVPQDYDQFDFAARIEYFETGIKAENINDTEDITQKLNILFNKEKWGELEQLSEDFKKYQPYKILDSEIKRLFQEYGGGKK